MELDLYQVDAFADGVFSGNPAAVVPLFEWLSDDLMQHIATENNLVPRRLMWIFHEASNSLMGAPIR